MKPQCVFIIGPESSGSTFIAKVIAQAVTGKPGWSGRGFNCCDDGQCDLGNNFVEPCTSTEGEMLVCHRSAPFRRKYWPPVEEWKQRYDCYWVLCTRDITISERSRSLRFEKDSGLCRAESKKARGILLDLIASEEKVFIFSYETMVYLGEPYIRSVFEFLGIEPPAAIPTVRDSNAKHIKIQAEIDGASS